MTPHSTSSSSGLALRRLLLVLGSLCCSVGSPSDAGAQREANVMAGSPTKYRPVLTQALGQNAIQPFAHLSSRTEWVSGFERELGQADMADHLGVDLLARIGLRFHTMKALSPYVLGLQLEGDLPTGFLTDPLPVAGKDMPHSSALGLRLRRAGLKFGYEDLVYLVAGLSTPQWGLGLVYNDGEERWKPGNMLFAEPREGDRALRALLGTGPLTSIGLKFGLGWELPLRNGQLFELTQLHNVMFSTVLTPMRELTLGLLLNARLGSTHAELSTGYWLADLFSKFTWNLGVLKWTFDAEVAVEGGDSEDMLAGSLKVGAVGRTQIGSAHWGIGLNVLYASRDPDTSASFQMDENTSFGWLMFPYLGQIHRGQLPTTTDSPSGLGLENLFGTQLKARWRPVDGLEMVVAGLVALQPTALSNQENWAFMGTEIDLGIRWRGLFWGTECTLGLEGAAVLPSALLGTQSAVFGGRFLFDYRL
jgi:hypothetical protein